MKYLTAMKLWIGTCVALAPLMGSAAILDSNTIVVVGTGPVWGTRYPENSLNGQVTSTTRETMFCVTGMQTGHIEYCFNESVALTALDIWNFNDVGTYLNNGMKEVEIRVSADWGQTYSLVTNSADDTTVFTLTKGTATTNIQPDTISLNHTATHLRIQSLSSYGNNYSGLSDVMFRGTRAEAIERITNVTVQAYSSNQSTARSMTNTVDGSPYSGDANKMWLANETNSWIVFDLQGVRRLSHLMVWNYAQANYTHRGMKDIRLQSSLDGVAFDPVTVPADGLYTLKRAVGTVAGNVAEYLDLGGELAAYLRLDCLSTHGDTSLSGLSEVFFYAEKEGAARAAGTVIMVR